jgi:hypothetical protein
MARKRMSVRAMARMKRENRELLNALDGVKQGYHGTRVSRHMLASARAAEIKTAHTLGYTTLIRDNFDGTFGVLAIRLPESR